MIYKQKFICDFFYIKVYLCDFLQIVQSSGGPDLGRSITCPLLSKDATDFLRGHLTPKEMQVWETLGERWTKSR